jgi:hypothetical protein
MQSAVSKKSKPQEVKSANKRPTSKPKEDSDKKLMDEWGISPAPTEPEPVKRVDDVKEPPVKIDFFGTDDTAAANPERDLLD